MSECGNCGAYVSDRYASDFAPADVDDPRACPHCPDLIRVGGRVREVRRNRPR